MVALIVSNQTTFGTMTNSVVSRIAGLNTSVLRLNEAVATATEGYTGTPGTEFEAVGNMPVGGPGTNNFGVQPAPDSPGTNGLAYADAVTQLTAQWALFWVAAAPFLKTLDNGMHAM